jgi:predicted DNA-binding protein (UPF0251 family)/predicted Fe-Mo cluster-binding NifX family protein
MTDRRRRTRCIELHPSHTCFKPCGVRGRRLDTVTLQADEFEALRLMDYEGLYQDECARRMGISRTTLSRSLAQARRKVTDALLNGKTLLIEVSDHATLSHASARSLETKVPDTPTFRHAGTIEPGATTIRPPKIRGNHMKIAVTSQNRRLVTEHAGKCRKFWIYEVVEGEVRNKRLLELPKEQSFHDSPRAAPHPLDTVDVLITSGMGRGLERRLRERGIEAVVTRETDPDTATQAYLAGTLVRLEAGCEEHHPE